MAYTTWDKFTADTFAFLVSTDPDIEEDKEEHIHTKTNMQSYTQHKIGKGLDIRFDTSSDKSLRGWRWRCRSEDDEGGSKPKTVAEDISSRWWSLEVAADR